MGDEKATYLADRPLPRRGGSRRIAQVALGGFVAALLGVLAAEQARIGDPQIRQVAPQLTFTGVNDLGPLRERLAREAASRPEAPSQETS